MSVEEQIEELLSDLEQEDTPQMSEGAFLVSVGSETTNTPSGGYLIASQGVHTSFVYDAPVAFCLTK
jgi:hypothetical protein|tara:strand:- start:2844 stop:3044 length:201 start_codon:yes stop_codon:yes gene_type:complete